MRRRKYLATAAGAMTVGLAGCFGDSDTNNPRSVVRAYIEAEHDEGDPEAMAALLHSDSPLDPTADGSTTDERSVTIDSLRLDERGLDGEQIASMNMQLSAETARAIGNQENALVEATYQIGAPELENGSTGFSSEQLSVQNAYLTATEGGDWLIVAFKFR